MNGQPTFSRDAWNEAQALWKAGEFSDEWKTVRHQAAFRGMIYPPTGTKWDSWEDDEPSQRAMLIRAIRETPELLSRCIGRSRSWSQVIERLMAERDELREERWRQTRQVDRDRDEATPRQATTTILGILERIWESRP